MDFKLYQAETEKTCLFHEKILEKAQEAFINDLELTEMEFQGVIHSLQVIIENAIGKAKHLLKYFKLDIPASAYVTFEYLNIHGIMTKKELHQWKSIVGLRNAIVHEYMSVNNDIIIHVVKTREYLFVVSFLKSTFSQFQNPS